MSVQLFHSHAFSDLAAYRIIPINMSRRNEFLLPNEVSEDVSNRGRKRDHGSLHRWARNEPLLKLGWIGHWWHQRSREKEGTKNRRFGIGSKIKFGMVPVSHLRRSRPASCKTRVCLRMLEMDFYANCHNFSGTWCWQKTTQPRVSHKSKNWQAILYIWDTLLPLVQILFWI